MKIYGKNNDRWYDHDFKRSSGEEQTTCPACSHTRKKKNDKGLGWNHDLKIGKCHHCEESFYIREMKKEYKLPPQGFLNHTNLSDNLVKWFKGRGISQNTLRENKITEERYYQPAKGKEMNNVVFNYFEDGVLVNKKYRSADKCFTQSKGTKKTLYGIDDITGDEAYIVEGEMDKLSLWEVGVKNCISLPNGAKDVNEVFENTPQLNDLKVVYIAVDMDTAGQQAERELIKRFGKWRCKRIHFKGKDANDDLQNGCLIESLVEPVEYPVDGCFTVKDFYDDLLDFYDNGYEDTIKPKGARWGRFNQEFSILMGQLTVITGIPSHGKSEFTEDYVLSLVNDYGYKASFYTPEHRPVKYHLGRVASKVIGKPFTGVSRMTKTELDQFKTWSEDKVFFTMPEQGEKVTWDYLFEKFKEQMFKFGIDFFVVDAFNKVRRKDPESRAEIEDTLMRLTQFVQDYNVHLFLVAHPTKMKKKEDGTYSKPTLYDVKGTGDFRDQAHNGLCVYRYFDTVEQSGYTQVTNLKTKFSHQGNIGADVNFDYDVTCNRYRCHGAHLDRSSYISVEQVTIEDEYNDLPF